MHQICLRIQRWHLISATNVKKKCHITFSNLNVCSWSRFRQNTGRRHIYSRDTHKLADWPIGFVPLHGFRSEQTIERMSDRGKQELLNLS